METVNIKRIANRKEGGFGIEVSDLSGKTFWINSFIGKCPQCLKVGDTTLVPFKKKEKDGRTFYNFDTNHESVSQFFTKEEKNVPKTNKPNVKVSYSLTRKIGDDTHTFKVEGETQEVTQKVIDGVKNWMNTLGGSDEHS